MAAFALWLLVRQIGLNVGCDWCSGLLMSPRHWWLREAGNQRLVSMHDRRKREMFSDAVEKWILFSAWPDSIVALSEMYFSCFKLVFISYFLWLYHFESQPSFWQLLWIAIVCFCPQSCNILQFLGRKPFCRALSPKQIWGLSKPLSYLTRNEDNQMFHPIQMLGPTYPVPLQRNTLLWIFFCLTQRFLVLFLTLPALVLIWQKRFPTFPLLHSEWYEAGFIYLFQCQYSSSEMHNTCMYSKHFFKAVHHS